MEPLRNEYLHLLSYQFFSRITKELLRLGIDELDFASAIHDDHSIRRRFEKITKFQLFLLAMTDVSITFKDRYRFSGGIGA